MRFFASICVVLLISAVASAQRRSTAPALPPQRAAGSIVTPVTVPSAGALGGSFASVGISRPLGGIVTTPSPQRHRSAASSGYRYVGPVYYVPNAYDSGYQSSGYSTFDQPANPVLYPAPSQAQASQAPQPIIINQYFSSRTHTAQTEEGSTTTTSETAQGDGAPIGGPQKYYLIAYKDHNVYSALAYWLEGDTLHYVTTQNTHNQASLALVDLDQTTKLNADNSVPFSLTSK